MSLSRPEQAYANYLRGAATGGWGGSAPVSAGQASAGIPAQQPIWTVMNHPILQYYPYEGRMAPARPKLLPEDGPVAVLRNKHSIRAWEIASQREAIYRRVHLHMYGGGVTAGEPADTNAVKAARP